MDVCGEFESVELNIFKFAVRWVLDNPAVAAIIVGARLFLMRDEILTMVFSNPNDMRIGVHDRLREPPPLPQGSPTARVDGGTITHRQ